MLKTISIPIKAKEILLFSFIFLFFFIFFTNDSPLIIADHDDWELLSKNRSFFSIIGTWNPIKLFTETLMSLCTDIATSLILPFNNDFIFSVAITSSIILSLFITLYCYFLYKLLVNISIGKLDSFLYCFAFIVFHFLVLKNSSYNNTFMFYCWDLTCYFNYLIPNLLNATLVLYLINLSPYCRLSKNSFFNNGFIILAIFFALFSNLFSSIILISYIISKLIINNNKYIFNKERMSEYILIIIWGITHILEMFGGRASYLTTSQETNFYQKFRDTISYLIFEVLFKMNPIFIVLLFISIVLLYFKLQDTFQKRLFQQLLFATFFCCAYIILLSTIVNPYYITRTDILFGPFFYIFTMMILLISSFINKYNSLKLCLPLFVCCLFFESRSNDKTYTNIIQNKDPKYWINLDNKIIQQVKYATDNNQEETTIEVPFKRGWPYQDSTGDKIARTLRKYNIINKPIKIKIKFNLDFSKSQNIK